MLWCFIITVTYRLHGSGPKKSNTGFQVAFPVSVRAHTLEHGVSKCNTDSASNYLLGLTSSQRMPILIKGCFRDRTDQVSISPCCKHQPLSSPQHKKHLMNLQRPPSRSKEDRRNTNTPARVGLKHQSHTVPTFPPENSTNTLWSTVGVVGGGLDKSEVETYPNP